MYSRLIGRSGLRPFQAQTRASTIWALPPVRSHMINAPSASAAVGSHVTANASAAALVVVSSPAALVVVSSAAALVVASSAAADVVVSSAPLSAQAPTTIAITMAMMRRTDGLLRRPPCVLVFTCFLLLVG